MSEPVVRTLVLLRHAEAADRADGGDHERPLTERGLADAEAAGAWLREQDVAPRQVLCSTALRTRQTWAQVVSGSGLGGLVDHEPGVYEAGVDDLIALIRGAEPEAPVVAVVGHAPGVPATVAALAGPDSDPQAAARLEQGWPTCTLAVLRVETPWVDLAPGAARLEAVHTARAEDDTD